MLPRTSSSLQRSCTTFLSCRGKEGPENCCFSTCISAQGCLSLVLMQKMSLVRQEKCETAVGADFPYLLPFPPPRFALHAWSELALQKQTVTGR